MIIADASVVLELLVGTASAPRIARRLLDPDESVHVPHLLDVEVCHALRRYANSGELDPKQAWRALESLLDLPLQRHEHTLLLERAWEVRRSVSAYDGIYIALAEALDAPLLTCDGRLARSHGHRARIELV